MHRYRLINSFIVAMIGSTMAIILFGLSPAGMLPFAALALFGLGDVVNQVAGNTLIQHSTPDELLGRVFGAFEAIIVSAVLIGALTAGPLIKYIGPRATSVSIAIVALVVLMACMPRLRILEAAGSGSDLEGLPVTPAPDFSGEMMAGSETALSHST